MIAQVRYSVELQTRFGETLHFPVYGAGERVLAMRVARDSSRTMPAATVLDIMDGTGNLRPEPAVIARYEDGQIVGRPDAVVWEDERRLMTDDFIAQLTDTDEPWDERWP